MGTTGGDRHKLLKDTEDAGVYAVIAPQMGKQVSMTLLSEQTLILQSSILCLNILFLPFC